jgi:transposase
MMDRRDPRDVLSRVSSADDDDRKINPDAWLDPHRRPWLIDHLLRHDPEILRLGADVARAGDRLRLALDDVQWILVLAFEEAMNARTVAAQDAVADAMIRACGIGGTS